MSMEDNKEYSFIYYGRTIISGDVIKMWGNFTNDNGDFIATEFCKEIKFLYVENGRFYIEVNGSDIYPHAHGVYSSRFPINITRVVISNRHKVPNEMKKDDISIGWIAYIAIMAISTIFKENIGLWILWTVVFFVWRHSKLYKED